MFEVLKEDTSGLQPCRNRIGIEIKSCVRVKVDFDTIDQSDRLKAFCTSVERRPDVEIDDTRIYEVNKLVQGLSITVTDFI